MPDGALGIEFKPTKFFDQEFYEVSSLHEYHTFCSYHYETDYERIYNPSEEAIRMAAKATRQLIDIIRKVIRIAQPEFGYGDINARIDRYLWKLEEGE
jgi:hypothetical protein